MRRGRNGFTLIELLVVIAVILILASILIVGLAAVLRETKNDEATIATSNMATGLAKMKAEFNMYGKPLAIFVDPTTMINRDKPTIAELQGRAAKINLAMELCPKRIFTDLTYQSPPNGLWPYINARKKNKDLPTNVPNSYDFATYFDPNNRSLLNPNGTVTELMDPWLKAYQYMVFEEVQDVVQPDGVTVKPKSVFIEVIVSGGEDLTIDGATTNYSTPGGYLDFGAHPLNQDNIQVEVGRWSPKVN